MPSAWRSSACANSREGQRVLILLTDGVNTAGVLDPLKAAELAKSENVRIHTIAFGGSGGGVLAVRPVGADAGRRR